MNLKELAELTGIELVVPILKSKRPPRLHVPGSGTMTTVCGNLSDHRPARPAEVAGLEECRACVLFARARERSLYRGPRPTG